MATKPHSKTTKAERNNDQLFPLFYKTFVTGTASEFATTADKFAHWLKVDKAYYPNARPTIIKLLEAAHTTVRQHSTHPDLHFHISRMDDGVRPFAEPYMRLIRTVAPFYLLFTELPLQMRLRDLIRTICDDVDKFLSQQPLVRRNSTTPSIATTRTTPLSPPVQSPVAPPSHAHTSPFDGSVLQSTVLPSSRTQYPDPLAQKAPDSPLRPLSNGTSSLTIKLPGRADIRLEDFSPRTIPPTVPQASQVTTSAVHPVPVAASPTIDSMASQSTRPKTKKRKFDFSDVLEEDVKWFKDTRPVQTEEPSVSSSTSPMHTTLSAVTPVTEVSDVQVTEVAHVKPPGPPVSALESTDSDIAPEVRPSSATLDADANTPALDAKTAVASRSPSVPSQVIVAPRSRSPSGPPQPAARSSLKRKAPDEVDARTANAACASHSPPLTPIILPPSITRRRKSSSPPVSAARPDVAETQPASSEPAVAALPPSSSSEMLPSPLSSRKKKKKRKGPPGLKFLPVDVPAEEERNGRSDLRAAEEDGRSAPGIIKGEEGVSGPEAKSRSKSPPPVPTPLQKPSVPPSEPPQPDPKPVPTVLSESDNTVVREKGEQARTPERPLDSVLEDTVVVAASPDAMEVDAALQPEPNGIARERVAPGVPEQEEVVPEEEAPRETQSHAQDLPCDDVNMGDSTPAPDIALAEATSASPESNGIVATVPQLEVLDSIKVNGIADFNIHEDKDGTMPGTVPTSNPVLSPLATMPAEPQLEDIEDRDLNTSPFESKAIRLLSLERGHPSHTSSQNPVELHFTLTEEEVAQVARWNNRGKTSSDLSTSMCVSLVSYPLEQCAQVFECEPDAEQGELDIVSFGRPRPWPQDGSVYVVLDVSGDHGPPRSINVAPPFGFDTIHKPVDLVEYGVHPGENTVHLFQFRDHSDRIFAVVLHHPTAVQLAALQAARDRDRALEDWMEDLGRFDLSHPKLVAIPVGSVIVYSRTIM